MPSLQNCEMEPSFLFSSRRCHCEQHFISCPPGCLLALTAESAGSISFGSETPAESQKQWLGASLLCSSVSFGPEKQRKGFNLLHSVWQLMHVAHALGGLWERESTSSSRPAVLITGNCLSFFSLAWAKSFWEFHEPR